MASSEAKGGIKSLVLQTGGAVVGLTVFSLLRTSMGFGWFMAGIYGLLVAFFLLGVLKPGETMKGRITDIALLAALALQFWLKFFQDVSWLWSIVASLALLLVLAFVFGIQKYATTMAAASGPTWIFGNLPPLELEHFPGGGGRSILDDRLEVEVNGESFYLGESVNADKLLRGRFAEGGGMDRVRARAGSRQKLLVARHCSAKAFGGEFVVASLSPELAEERNTPVILDSTAFLFFGSRGIERITVVVCADVRTMEYAVMSSFNELACEMYGEAVGGSRGQQMWEADGGFLVCEEESLENLRRGTFVWTNEELDVGRG